MTNFISPLPEAALRVLADALPKPKQAEPHEANGSTNGELVVTASNPAAAWFRKAIENESGKVATAREGDRHSVLLSAARTLGGTLHHGYLTGVR